MHKDKFNKTDKLSYKDGTRMCVIHTGFVTKQKEAKEGYRIYLYVRRTNKYKSIGFCLTNNYDNLQYIHDGIVSFVKDNGIQDIKKIRKEFCNLREKPKNPHKPINLKSIRCTIRGCKPKNSTVYSGGRTIRASMRKGTNGFYVFCDMKQQTYMFSKSQLTKEKAQLIADQIATIRG